MGLVGTFSIRAAIKPGVRAPKATDPGDTGRSRAGICCFCGGQGRTATAECPTVGHSMVLCCTRTAQATSLQTRASQLPVTTGALGVGPMVWLQPTGSHAAEVGS